MSMNDMKCIFNILLSLASDQQNGKTLPKDYKPTEREEGGRKIKKKKVEWGGELISKEG